MKIFSVVSREDAGLAEPLAVAMTKSAEEAAEIRDLLHQRGHNHVFVYESDPFPGTDGSLSWFEVYTNPCSN